MSIVGKSVVGFFVFITILSLYAAFWFHTPVLAPIGSEVSKPYSTYRPGSRSGSPDMRKTSQMSTCKEEERNPDGMTLLIFKAHQGDSEEVQRLVFSGASLWAADKRGVTALLHASYFGHTKVVQALLSAGDLSILQQSMPERGSTSLHLASQNGHVEVVKALVASGDVELLLQTEEDGYSCLHIAALQVHLIVVDTLVKADRKMLFLETSEGCTCLHSASVSGHLDVVKYLVEAGGKELLFSTDERGWSALHYAAIKGHVDVVECLVRLGGPALLHLKAILPCGSIDTALDAARASGQTAAVVALRDFEASHRDIEADLRHFEAGHRNIEAGRSDIESGRSDIVSRELAGAPQDADGGSLLSSSLVGSTSDRIPLRALRHTRPVWL